MKKERTYITILIIVLTYVIIPQLYWTRGANFSFSKDELFFLVGYLLIILLFFIPAATSFFAIRTFILKETTIPIPTYKKGFIAAGIFFGGLLFIYAIIIAEIFWPIDYGAQDGQAGMELLIYPFFILGCQAIGLVVGTIIKLLVSVFSIQPNLKSVLISSVSLFVLALCIALIIKSRQKKRILQETESSVMIDNHQIKKTEFNSESDISFEYVVLQNYIRPAYNAWRDKTTRNIFISNKSTKEEVHIKDYFSMKPKNSIVVWKNVPVFISSQTKSQDYLIKFTDLTKTTQFEPVAIKDIYGSIQKAEVFKDKTGKEFLTILIHRNYLDKYQSLVVIINDTGQTIYIDRLDGRISGSSFVQCKMVTSDEQILIVKSENNNTQPEKIICYQFFSGS